MALVLVLHYPQGDATVMSDIRNAVRDAIWEVADAHWVLSDDAVIAATDLSSDYLLSHFSRAVARRGHEASGPLLIIPIAAHSAFRELPEEAERWMRDRLE